MSEEEQTNIQTISKLKEYIRAAEEMLALEQDGENDQQWSPSAKQWKVIRQKIFAIDDNENDQTIDELFARIEWLEQQVNQLMMAPPMAQQPQPQPQPQPALAPQQQAQPQPRPAAPQEPASNTSAIDEAGTGKDGQLQFIPNQQNAPDAVEMPQDNGGYEFKGTSVTPNIDTSNGQYKSSLI